jgi:hypothetical protein
MSSETFQSQELAATPRLGFNVSSSCIVCNNKSIDRIRFTKSYIAFGIIFNCVEEVNERIDFKIDRQMGRIKEREAKRDVC